MSAVDLTEAKNIHYVSMDPLPYLGLYNFFCNEYAFTVVPEPELPEVVIFKVENDVFAVSILHLKDNPKPETMVVWIPGSATLFMFKENLPR